MVTVLVGPEETAFRIHKGLLCSKSEYFRAAFEGSFRESTEKKIQLRDEDSKIFQFYAALIYTDKAALSWNEEEFDVDVCCRLYVLADRLGSENIQNIVMDVIHGRCSRLDLPIFGLGTINHVFNNTLPGSRLRAILIDVASYDMDLDNQPELVNADPEFLFEVMKLCARRLPRYRGDEEAPLNMDRCKMYHVHKDGRTVHLLHENMSPNN